MTRIYVIRHAEAEGNLYRRIQGWYDSLITDRGYHQIAALEERFEHEKIDAVYSSDRFRTMTTAGAIYKTHGLPLLTRPALRELHMGAWEDSPWGQAAYATPEQLAFFNSSDSRWTVPGAETFAQVGQRLTDAMLKIAAENQGRTVAVFSHGMAIRSLQGTLLGLAPEEWVQFGHPDNTAVTCIEVIDGKAKIVYHNDNSHLSAEISTLASQNWWKRTDGFLSDRNLRYAPMDLQAEGEAYLQAKRETWAMIYGNLDGFDGEGFLREAREQCSVDPRSVLRAYLQNEPVGILQLDLQRDAKAGVGYLPFYYIAPDWRCQGLGVQLMGEAISVYRPLKRDKLCLRCSPQNLMAQRFYRRYGFEKAGETKGKNGMLDVLEKQIGY